MADLNDDDLPTFEGWDTLEMLGEGGMCVVYRLRPSAGDGPERAAKVLYDTTPSSIARFIAEAHLLRKIDHVNVLTIHDLHADARPPWIVMDLLTGHDLEAFRESRGAMDPERAARLIADVANGLAQVHAIGVRHRDIKPANIMLGADGIARLIDFGIAREMTKAHTTSEGLVVGTASYLPPEIYIGDDARAVQDTENADVYALGMTLCEMLTGVAIHSFEGVEGPRVVVELLRDKMARDALDPREWRPQVPAGLAEIVMRATAQEPGERTQSAQQLEAELRDWLIQRKATDAAPVSRIDKRTLPKPPGHRDLTPNPLPATARGQTQTGKVVAHTGAAAASAAGITGSMGLLLVVTLIGLGLLWGLQPSVPVSDPEQTSAIEAGLRQHETALWQCSPNAAASFVLEFSVERGRVDDVRISPTSTRAADCLVAATEAMYFPKVRGPMHVRLPLQFE